MGTSGGRHPELLRLASAVGNRRMAQIARDPWGRWYGPPIGDEEEEEDLTGITAPPGLDLDFLDEPEPSPWYGPPAQAAEQEEDLSGVTAPPGLDLGFLDEPRQATLATVPPSVTQHAAPVQAAEPATVPPSVTQHAAAAQQAPPPRQAPQARQAAPSRMGELAGLEDERRIRLLTRKVEELLAAGACVVEASAPYVLKGGTVEVKLTVRERSGAPARIAFVAHYHPEAGAARVGQTAASRFHIKKWTNAEKHNRDDTIDATSCPNLMRIVPKMGAVKGCKTEARPGQALYKPRN